MSRASWSRLWTSLRVRLAVLGFLAIYVPALLLFGVTTVTEDEQVEDRDGVEVASQTSDHDLSWSAWTVVALAPVAALLAWWLAGRAVRPIERVRAVAEDIEASDLGRRIDLDHGPSEVVSLAASFDSMLDRLERSATTQQRLIEETSHGLRTPLAVLSTNADVLLAHPEPTVELYRQGLERSKSAAARLTATVDELLLDARGRARTLDRHPADLAAIVRGVVDEVRPGAEPRAVALSVSGPETVVCTLDEPMVRRAIANIVDNAVRHAPEGTSVDVHVALDEHHASVEVTDDGPGIAAEDRDHVFERFWRGPTDSDGTGLGLPIARQIARAHGGDVTVTSPASSGAGCAFELRLRR
ncbi:MAG TPA: HAMP domain-containing sensor histidine kinase [Nocardioidaceae bacterium]|nr:HAMP domain-containing sensor histidine kinase [Nocardioidaceae bacterium]